MGLPRRTAWFLYLVRCSSWITWWITASKLWAPFAWYHESSCSLCFSFVMPTIPMQKIVLTNMKYLRCYPYFPLATYYGACILTPSRQHSMVSPWLCIASFQRIYSRNHSFMLRPIVNTPKKKRACWISWCVFMLSTVVVIIQPSPAVFYLLLIPILILPMQALLVPWRF